VFRFHQIVCAWLMVVATVAAATLTTTAAAQPAPWPCKVVRWVVPYPPGGSSDVLARLLAPKLMQRFATTIVVENRPGAVGNIGTAQAASAPADGCTWLLGNATNVVISRNLYTLAIDPMQALQAVAEVAAAPLVLYINAQVPAQDVRALVALLREHPDKYSYATPGSGAPHHMLVEKMKLIENVSAIHVPYRGAGPAIADVLAGHVSFAFEATSAITPHLASGKVRALATTGGERSASLPDVPTMRELGYADFVVTNWYGVFVPTGTPTPLVDALNAAIRDAIKLPDVAQMLVQLDAFNGDYDAAQYQQFVAAQAPYWAALVKQTGVQID